MLLLGHATRSPLWDIPKGITKPGEGFPEAAARELREETGLAVAAGALRDLGVHRYVPAKDLALFLWHVAVMPDPAGLRCTSFIRHPGGGRIPEMDAFAVLPWDRALARTGRNMARVLAGLRGGPAWSATPD